MQIGQSLNSKRPIKKLFNKIKQEYGGNLFIENRRSLNHLDFLKWNLTKRELVERAIARILSYIVVRKIDLNMVLEFYKTHSRQKIYVDNTMLRNDAKSYKEIA